ncbi:MAG TPA: phosphate ABC transporter substrate-binding protein PstS [Thermoplasmata archaeon]|nr:phosphate ABC transporter substrate-binding protein PstS [Thermoplasmata archaeon]
MTTPAGSLPATPPNPPAPAAAPARKVVRRSARRGGLVVVGVVIVVAILIGVGFGTHWYGLAPAGSTSATCPTGVTVAGAGASFLSALLSNWETSYHAATANEVSYDPSGAGAGITSFSESTVDFAATDEPLTSTEVAGLPGTTLTLPVSGGAVTVVYNIQGYSGPLNLTVTQLAGIYLGDFTSWNNAALTANNPGLPDQPIITVHRSDGAGTTYVLTNFLSNGNATWNTSVGISIQPSSWPTTSGGQEAEHGNAALAAYVATTPNTIGYVDLADAESHALLTAAIQNPSGDYIAPTVANTQSAINDLAGRSFPSPTDTSGWSGLSWINAPGASDYPLATLSYFLVLQNPGIGYQPSLAKTTVLVQWLRWAVDDGQSVAASLYYVSPPAGLLSADLSAISTVNYNGTSIPTCG